MSITINERKFGGIYENEQFVVLGDKGDSRIMIHPWDRKTNENPREVYVAVGYMSKHGTVHSFNKRGERKKNGKKEFHQNAIFDRADFVEALLAVFPELKRAES